MPREIISDRDTRFTSHFWRELCDLLEIQQGLSTAFHPQSDGQTERVNRILEDMLRHYVNPLLDDWDEHLDAVEFAVNNAWQASIRTTPFFLNYGLHPHTPSQAELPNRVPAAAQFTRDWQMTVSEARRFLEGAEQRATAADQREREAEKSLDAAKSNMQSAQTKQKHFADKLRSKEPNFEIGSEVLLSTKNIQWKHPGARKLLPLWIGPFKVLQQVGKVAYKVELPDGMKMHNVFHVSLLKSFVRGTGKVIPPPPPELIAGNLEYEAERVLDHDPQRGKYLIKWTGYGHENNTWEPEKHLKGCSELVQDFWQTVEARKSGR